MSNLKKAFKKILTRSERPSSATAGNNTEYEHAIHVGLKTKIKRALQRSAAIQYQEHQLLLSTREVPASVEQVNAVSAETDGSKDTPSTIRTSSDGYEHDETGVSTPEGTPSNVIDFAYVNNVDHNRLQTSGTKPARDGTLDTNSGPSLSDEPKAPIMAEPDTTPDSGDCDNGDNVGKTYKPSVAESLPKIELGTSSTPDLGLPSNRDDTPIITLTGFFEPSSRTTNSVTQTSTEITTPTLPSSVTTSDECLAPTPYEPFLPTPPSAESSSATDSNNPNEENGSMTQLLEKAKEEPVACNCEEKHAAELEDLKEEMKEEYEIEIEIQTEKLQDRHDEKIKKLRWKLKREAKSKEYIKKLGWKKLNHALEAKRKVEQTLFDVEGFIKVKDAVIEVTEASAARLQRSVDVLKGEKEFLIQEHAAILSQIRHEFELCVAGRETEVRELVDQLHNGTTPGVDALGISDLELIQYFAQRPEEAALAYVNARKELTLAEKHTLELENQLNRFNYEYEQDPARLAGVTRLLEFKDGRILELQKIAGQYHDALEQAHAKSLRDQEHSKADAKLREEQVDWLLKEKADVSARLEETRQGWENVAQMFGHQVFGEDIANSMNELYDVVKQDNSFLCQKVEAQTSQMMRQLEKEKHLKLKIRDYERAAEKLDGDHGQLREDLRAAQHATETTKIEAGISVDILKKQLMDKDAALTTLNARLETMMGIVDASVTPNRGSAALLRQKDVEIVSLTQEVQETRSKNQELGQAIQDYEDLKNWKGKFDRMEIQQEFAVRGLQEKAVQLEEQLRAALLASDPAKFETARSMVEKMGEMVDAWSASKTECERFKLQAGHDNELLHNERIYFTASIEAAREVLMVVWRRYATLWDSLRTEDIVLEIDRMGPQDIADEVAQIFEDDDNQRAGNDAIARSMTAAARDLRYAPSMQQPESEETRYGDRFVDAAQALLEQELFLAEEQVRADHSWGPDPAAVRSWTPIEGSVRESFEAYMDVPSQTDVREADIAVSIQTVSLQSHAAAEGNHSLECIDISHRNDSQSVGANDLDVEIELGLEELLIRDADYDEAEAKSEVEEWRRHVDRIYSQRHPAADELQTVYGPTGSDLSVEEKHQEEEERKAIALEEFRPGSPKVWICSDR
ncbi:MAG: hypothetical protein L6R40_006380 [Gallowayella cf. fulva]|nr:MAG: hypothetical protein L6R40_006380 [Xanthomendoza cf. fulva]